MAVPQHLISTIESLRGEINRANVTNWKLLFHNAGAHITNLQSDVELADGTSSACRRAVAELQAYAALIGDLGVFFSADDSKSLEYKAAALSALDDLEATLDGIRPSQKAIVLGYAW